MPNRIDENVLRATALCPLIELDISTPPLYATALQTLRWALLRAFTDGVPPSRESLREKYAFTWKKTYYPELKTEVPDADSEFWAGPKMARTVAAKISRFLARYTVLHPDQPYELMVGDLAIQGHYALVRRSKPDGVPAIVVPHDHAPLHKAYPDVTSLARCLHGLRQGGLEKVGVIHVPLLRGEEWAHKPVARPLVEEWVGDIVEVIHHRRFPAPGSHCERCVGKPCLEVFQ